MQFPVHKNLLGVNESTGDDGTVRVPKTMAQKDNMFGMAARTRIVEEENILVANAHPSPVVPIRWILGFSLGINPQLAFAKALPKPFFPEDYGAVFVACANL